MSKSEQFFFSFARLFTSPRVGERGIAMSVSVCLSVCLLAYLKNDMSKLHEISVLVTVGRASVLL